MDTSPTTSSSPVTAGATDDVRSQPVRIRLSVGDRSAIATLADNPTASDFATLLPLTLSMTDLMGHEKPGSLPRALDQGDDAVFTYEVGQVGYWRRVATLPSSTPSAVIGPFPARASSRSAVWTPVWVWSPAPATTSGSVWNRSTEPAPRRRSDG